MESEPFINQFFQQDESGVHVSPQQASDFAKRVAGDFNPIHDPEHKRFCVPGDLLFALVLNRYGLSQKMEFEFAGMVGDGIFLNFPDGDETPIVISDNKKKYLSIERSGDNSHDPDLIRSLACSYVEFSGQTFPHILVPLMEQHNVMINPDRPLVIYERMAIDIDRLDINSPKLKLAGSTLNVEGKRGNVKLEFKLVADGEVVGHGEKSMVLSGLREFERGKIDQLVNDYAARKDAYTTPA